MIVAGGGGFVDLAIAEQADGVAGMTRPTRVVAQVAARRDFVIEGAPAASLLVNALILTQTQPQTVPTGIPETIQLV